jgi:thioredoxin 1
VSEAQEVSVAQVFDTPINSNDQSLQRVLSAGLPVALVFVDGGAGLDETLNRLAQANAGKLLVVKVRAGENPESTRRFQVRSLPAVVTVRQNETLSKAEAVSPPEVEQHVAYLLGNGPKPIAARPATEGRGAAGGPTAAPGAQPLVVTDASFDADVVRSPQPVLIDFWAPWCGPCRIVAPTVEKLAREMGGRLRVGKVNVDENPAISMRYGVQGIPTLIVFKNGQPWRRQTGALPEAALRRWVDDALRG